MKNLFYAISALGLLCLPAVFLVRVKKQEQTTKIARQAEYEHRIKHIKWMTENPPTPTPSREEIEEAKKMAALAQKEAEHKELERQVEAHKQELLKNREIDPSEYYDIKVGMKKYEVERIAGFSGKWIGNSDDGRAKFYEWKGVNYGYMRIAFIQGIAITKIQNGITYDGTD